MLVTVHLEQTHSRLLVQGEMSEEEAEVLKANLAAGEWVEMAWPPGSPDKIRINPRWVSAVQLVS